jgi:hypothetical protein
MARHGNPLRVEVPSPREESLRLGRVGIIAGIGFVLGVLWPSLAGVDLVPSPPQERASRSADDPEDSATDAKPSGAAVAAPDPPKLADRLKVGAAQWTSCRSADDKPGKDCQLAALESLLEPHLLALATCEAAKDAEGMLSLGFDLEFSTKQIGNFRSGKSTSFTRDKTEGLIECAKNQVGSVALDGVEHAHDRYTVFYVLEFIEPQTGGGDAGVEGEVVPASGRATVGWHVALIRATPPEGDVVARLLSGTQVIVTGRQGDWYRVKYDAKGREGWVFKSAIGL